MESFGNAVKNYIKRVDLPLFLLGIAAALFGMVIIFSVGTHVTGTTNTHLVMVQGAALGIGVLGFLLINLLDIDHMEKLWIILFFFNIAFQLSLFIIGTEGDTGKRSWIRFGPIGIQPGEIGKLIFIYTFSCHIRYLEDKINSWFSVLQLLVHGGITVLSVFIPSRDLGVALTYVFIMAVMLWLSPLSPLWSGAMTLSGIVSVPVIWNYVLNDNQKMRILVIYDPEISPRHAYQAQQSLKALHNGGLFGMGYGKGDLSQSAYLPAKHTDFIFSSCGEELGYIGCAAIVLLLGVIIALVLIRAAKMGSVSGYLTAVGVGAMFLFQTVVNVGMCLGVLPVIGITLPFFSYGGSSVMTSILALSLVSVYYNSGRSLKRLP